MCAQMPYFSSDSIKPSLIVNNMNLLVIPFKTVARDTNKEK